MIGSVVTCLLLLLDAWFLVFVLPCQTGIYMYIAMWDAVKSLLKVLDA